MTQLRQRRPDLEHITLNASLNAADIYRRWGCRETGPQFERHGTRAIPMCLTISDFH